MNLTWSKAWYTYTIYLVREWEWESVYLILVLIQLFTFTVLCVVDDREVSYLSIYRRYDTFTFTLSLTMRYRRSLLDIQSNNLMGTRAAVVLKEVGSTIEMYYNGNKKRKESIYIYMCMNIMATAVVLYFSGVLCDHTRSTTLIQQLVTVGECGGGGGAHRKYHRSLCDRMFPHTRWERKYFASAQLVSHCTMWILLVPQGQVCTRHTLAHWLRSLNMFQIEREREKCKCKLLAKLRFLYLVSKSNDKTG